MRSVRIASRARRAIACAILLGQELVSGAAARAEVTIPAAARAGAPVDRPELSAVCGSFVDLMAAEPLPDPCSLANLPYFQARLDHPDQPGVVNVASLALTSLDVAGHLGRGCVSQGDFGGPTLPEAGATWPIANGGLSGTVGAARIAGFLNVAGPAGAPARWTVGVIGNDSVELRIGGVLVVAQSWNEGSWKTFAWVTFPEPGVYPFEARWATDHYCDLDPLEIVYAATQVPGFDQRSCATEGMTYQACDDQMPTPSPPFDLVGVPVLLATPDGRYPAGSADSDGDTLADGAEGSFCGLWRDTDRDGTPDHLDSDSDGDGVPDRSEALSTETGRGSRPQAPGSTRAR